MKSSRTWRESIAVFAMAASIVTLAEANPAVASGPAAFLNRADMRDWLADGEHGLWIQAGNLRWYYARFAGICHGVNSTNSLAFDTRASDNIDQKSAVIVPGGTRCSVQSFAPSGGPPKKRYADVLLQPQSQ
ncbi:MAG TPA: hypothetical protein VE266_03850 [Steroidobacteraceae bacterium]|nr:hypothetical protein [Steroidobacteraceae bacterium]